MATLISDPEVTQALAALEDLWACVDDLFDRMTDADWRRKHGKDWIFADLPYHLSYFDREVVADPIRRGTDVPIAEQRVMRTMDELNAWNAAHFAQRPVGETPAESVRRARAAREAVREAAAVLDADPERMGFVSLPGCGWGPCRMGLGACLGHSWMHFQEARLRLGRGVRLPSPDTVHRAVSFYMAMMPLFADPKETAKGPFTASMVLTGAGGGSWTYRIRDGKVTTEDGLAADADVAVSQTPDTFVKTMTKVHSPMWAMMTGKIKVKGFGKMGRFGKIFAEPGPGREFPAARERL